MKREEAIKILSNHEMIDVMWDKADEALNMAIDALEQQPCEDCQRIYKPNPYYDCISRQNAIDAMLEELDEDTTHKVRDILELQPSVMPNQEPCEDCISRKDVYELIEDINDTVFGQQVSKGVANLPSVQPKPKTGHWIEKDGYDGDTYYDCSECGESWTTIDGTPWNNGMKYCPNCGAKMESEDKE